MALNILTPSSCDWLNVEVSINAGAPITLQTIKKVEWNTKVNAEKVYGAGNKAYDTTSGVIEIDNAKMTVGWSDWKLLLNAVSLLSLAQGAFIINPTLPASQLDLVFSKQASFNVTINYTLPIGPVPVPNVVTWRNARIVGVSSSNEQGPEAQMVELEFMVLDITQSP